MRKNNCIKVILISFFIIIFAFSKNAFAIDKEEQKNALEYARYDLRDYIDIAVKNQGAAENCWAISANSVIESNIEKTTNSVSPIFSARYLDYATSKTFLDGINPKAYNREVVDEKIGGGNVSLALAFYTCGNGPILESDMPFKETNAKINLEEIEGFQVQKQIKDYIRFPVINKQYSDGGVVCFDSSGRIYSEDEVKNIREQIKQHIVSYGAISSKTYAKGVANDSRKYFNNSENIVKSTAYFCNNTKLNADHQITIIGWDDNYSASNFNSELQPSSNGAYIVLNSWGESFGENGIYYISYEDVFIEQDLLGVISTTDIDYDNLYQHDELGMNYSTYIDGNAYCANIYSKNTANENEYLTEIGISSLTDSKCDIYVNSTNDVLDEQYLTKVFSDVSLKNGYQTFKLDNPIKLSGEKFIIVVKYKSDEKGMTYVGLEHKDDFFWNTAKSERGESFLSYDLKKWTDLKDVSTDIIPANSNFSMKAFTKYIEENDEEDYFDILKYELNNLYFTKISPKTKIENLIANIHTNLTYNIYDKNNNEVSKDSFAATEMKLNVKDKIYELVVIGDINGDGKITITDVVLINLFNIHIKEPNAIEKIAADVNFDNKISITDVVMANLSSINLKEL